MKKPKKWLYALGAVLLVLPLAVLLAINLYIQSAPFKSNLEKTLARNLQLHLHIQEITFAPWSGLRATADSLAPNGKPVPNAPKTTLVGDLELFPLLARQVKMHRVTLYDPRAEWILGADPAVADSASAGNAAVVDRALLETRMAGLFPSRLIFSAQASGTASEGAVTPTAAGEPASGSGGEENGVAVLLTSIRVERGELAIRQAGKLDLGVFKGITLEARSDVPGEYDGNITVKDALLLGNVPLANLKTPVKYRPGVVEFASLESQVGGGKLEGKLAFKEIEKKTHFSTDLDFYDIKLSAITPKDDERMKFEKGTMEGGVRMEGELEQWEQATGTAEMVVTDAGFSRESMISRIGHLLRIDELSNLSAKRVWVSGRLQNGVFTIEKGELKSDSVLLTAGGTVYGEAQLKLKAQLHISKALSEKIPQAFTKELKPSPVDGFRFIDFTVRGPINKPRTDLVDRLFPGNSEPMGLLLRSFFPEQTRLLPEDEEPALAPAAVPQAPPPPTPAVAAPALEVAPAPLPAPAPAGAPIPPPAP